MAEQTLPDGEGYRRAILTHLTSWVQDHTDVVTDPDAADSASIENALNEVNGVVFEIEGKTYRKPLGLAAQQLLVAAELVMQSAAAYAGSDPKAEMRCSRAALTLLDEAFRFFNELAEERAAEGGVGRG